MEFNIFVGNFKKKSVKMDEIPLNIKIKQEKLTPPRVEPKDDVDKLLDLKLFESEKEEKKNVTESK